jgi:DNA-binding NarL/FixJ family response regulator
VTREGFAARLNSHPDVTVVAAIGHSEAQEWPSTAWERVDIAVVDAADHHGHDQFPGVAVVRSIRSVRSREETLVIVVTAMFFHDGLRRRMREAEADFFFFREDLWDNDRIIEAVLHPETFRRGTLNMELLDDDEAKALGVQTKATVNEFVEFVSDHKLHDVLGTPPSVKGRPPPRHRWWRRTRQSATAAGRITPTNRTDSHPSPDRDAASLGQLRDLWVWATQIWPSRPYRGTDEEPTEDEP